MTSFSQKPVPRMLRIAEVMEYVGVSRSTIYNWTNPKSPHYEPTFPGKVMVGGRSVRWREAEIQAWNDSRQRALNAPPISASTPNPVRNKNNNQPKDATVTNISKASTFNSEANLESNKINSANKNSTFKQATKKSIQHSPATSNSIKNSKTTVIRTIDDNGKPREFKISKKTKIWIDKNGNLVKST